MERDRYVTIVIFAEGVKLTDFKGRYWRLLRKNPMTFWYLFWAWVARHWAGSDFRHVCVSDGEVVFDGQYGQTSFWPYEAFIRRYPRILGYYLVEGGDPQIHALKGGKKQRYGLLLPFPFIFMGLTRGLYQVRNCTTVARETLGRAGVQVPRRKNWNPTELHLWMSANGFDFTASAPPSISRAARKRARPIEPPCDGGLTHVEC